MRRKAEIPAMLYVPESVSWGDAAPALGKDYHAAIYSYRSGCFFCILSAEKESFFFFT